MLKHREIHTLDADEIRDEIKRRKQLLETMKYREQLEFSKEVKSTVMFYTPDTNLFS